MVKLNKIYTKTGDDGTTGLSDGSRVKKYDLRPSAYGDVDELNSFIGLSINCINNDKKYSILSHSSDFGHPTTSKSVRV